MRDAVSFTQTVKEELASNTYEKDRKRALLSAFIRINGHLSFHNRDSSLTLESENAKIAKFLYQMLKEAYSVQPKLEYLKGRGFGRSLIYQIRIESMGEDILEDLDISFLDGKISKSIVKNDDTISGYLAGAFLASGSINSPKTPNYHLEISLNSENHAKWLSHLFARYKNTNIEPRISKRRDSYIVYIKKSDKIADFLIMVGAVNSCMEYESIRIDRDFTNNANRLTNLDTANMSKTVMTSTEQAMKIRFIDDKVGLDSLSDKKLMLLCHLRLENESASMNDLANLMTERLKKPVSKSNVAHLFRKLDSLYDALKGDGQC